MAAKGPMLVLVATLGTPLPIDRQAFVTRALSGLTVCLLLQVWPRLHDAELGIVRAILCVFAVVFVIVGTVYLRGGLPSLWTRVLRFVAMSMFYVSFSR